MGLPPLDNLLRAGQLKAEPPNEKEVGRMLARARTHLADAKQKSVSPEGRFSSAYTAAHAAALAALRWHGYRSENRFLVFQSLAHTLGWPAGRWRVLDAAHKKRNLAEYEGEVDIEESTIAELIAVTTDLIDDVTKLAKR